MTLHGLDQALIKVAFWYDRPLEYSGGLNYMRNLLFALSKLEEKKIQPYIFFGKKVDDVVASSFEDLAIVVRTSVLDRLSPAWFIQQILIRIFGSLQLIHFVIGKYGISVVSHAEHVYGESRPFRVISWIPDFQYLHLPNLFPELDPGSMTKRVKIIAAQSDALILSSYSALEDYRRIAESTDGVTVLQFVSQPSGALKNAKKQPTLSEIETRYGFHGPYFFLPNQFWRHKNHAVVFRAVKELKEMGIEVLLLCTGNSRDYRLKDTTYIDGLLEYIEENNLGENIRILGLIDYVDVLILMRHSVATLNPSLFEGWSSTVEEAKSMGKRLILSDIPVHREQDPSGAVYFHPDDEQSLAHALTEVWANPVMDKEIEDEKKAALELHGRTLAYARKYTELVLSLK